MAVHYCPVVILAVIGITGKVKSGKTARLLHLQIVKSDPPIIVRSAKQIKIAVADCAVIASAQAAEIA